jgi:hypothetical protein
VNVLIGLLLAAVTATNNPPASVEKVAPAAAVEKIPVFLQTDAQDEVGIAYVTKLRQALEGSTTYQSLQHPAGARFVVGILTMDPNEANVEASTGLATVAAVTLQRDNGTGMNQFVYSWVLVARKNTVDSLAADLLTAIDKEIQDFEKPVIRFLDEQPQ